MRKLNCVRRLLALFLSLALLALAGCAVGERPSSAAAVTDEPFDGLEVTVLDAGKADAILLKTPDSAVLIDCGEKGFGDEILGELAARGIEKLDLLIVTHFDRDHVGGAAKVIGGVEIGRVLQNDFRRTAASTANTSARSKRSPSRRRPCARRSPSRSAGRTIRSIRRSAGITTATRATTPH